MTGQVSLKVSGPWRMLVRQDNQSVRVVNSNEDFAIILNEGAQTTNLQISMLSTDMPYAPPGAAVDETKAFAPDPHEPDKTLKQREMAFDPTLREKEMREHEARNRLPPGVVGSPALGKPSAKDWLDMTDEEIEAEQKKRDEEEAEKARLADVAEKEKASKTSTTTKKK